MNRSFVTPPEYAGARLDRFVSEVSAVSKNLARIHCDEGNILVNGRRSKAGLLLKGGEKVTFLSPVEAVQVQPALDDSAVRVLHEDGAMLVVEKLRALPSVRLRNDGSLTVADCIAALAPETAGASPDRREAGLIHRLDNFTTGVMVAAKSREVWEELRESLKQGRIEKSYLALVEGTVERTIEIAFPIVYGPKLVKMGENGEGEQALTVVQPVRRFQAGAEKFSGKKLSIVRCRADSARRHQIRAHMSAVDHPLVGDADYGAALSLSALGLRQEGFLLHAEQVVLDHPQTGERITFNCESRFLQEFLRQP